MKIMMTAGFVLLGIGSIAGAFFFHDGVQKNKALIDHMEKIAALTLKISTMAGHLENFRQKASEDEHLIEKLQDELEVMADLNASLKDTKASDAAVRRAIAACRGEKASLETLLTDERNKVRTIGLRLETVRQEIFDLSQKNEEKDRSIRSLEAALSKLEAEKAREKGAADRQIGALQSDSAQGLLRLQEAKETIRDHEIQIDAMKRSIQDMETRLGHTADENQRYRIRLKKMAVDNAAKDTQISYLLTEIQRTED